MHLPSPCGLVTLLTDFGARDPYVGIVKGAIKRANLRAEIVDLCHEVPPQDVAAGAMFLGAARGRFPAGTVHVAVVDPGVGSARRILAVCAAECYWLAPDNGLATELWRDDPGCEIRAVSPERLGISIESSTFHGRDVFAPLAGMLSGGRYGFRSLGERVADPITLASPDDPCVVWVDHYGNLITNLPGARAASVGVAIEIGGRRVPVVPTYSAAPEGAVVAVVDSYGMVEVAVVGGSASLVLGLGRGAKIAVVPQE